MTSLTIPAHVSERKVAVVLARKTTRRKRVCLYVRLCGARSLCLNVCYSALNLLIKVLSNQLVMLPMASHFAKRATRQIAFMVTTAMKNSVRMEQISIVIHVQRIDSDELILANDPEDIPTKNLVSSLLLCVFQRFLIPVEIASATVFPYQNQKSLTFA